MAHDTITCPLCLKCILSDEQKAAMWRLMDEQVGVSHVVAAKP
jgi:hypothetical protein